MMMSASTSEGLLEEDKGKQPRSCLSEAVGTNSKPVNSKSRSLLNWVLATSSSIVC